MISTACYPQDTVYGLESTPPPKLQAKPYAPEFFAGRQNLTRFGLAISADNQRCYYAVALNDKGLFREEIRFTQQNPDGTWTEPEPLLSAETKYKYVDPHFSPDGQRLFFIYTKPADPASARPQQWFDIWYVNRTDDGWSLPVNVGAPVSTPHAHEYYVSLTSGQTMFFGSNRADPDNFDLYAAELGQDGAYQQPQTLKGEVNTSHYEADVIVAPDESYIIFSSSGREDGLGRGDLYVSFKDAEGNWSAGKNLGDGVNSEQQEFAPSLSDDQQALFFSRGGVIHWVSTSVIDAQRP